MDNSDATIFEILLFCVFFLLWLIPYYVGKRNGIRHGYWEVASRTRRRIGEQIIDPWIKEFRNQYMGQTNSYAVDSKSLESCFHLAESLYRLRRLLPNDLRWDKNGESIATHATTCLTLSIPYSTVDLYFGSPQGYVDAFVHIIETNGGKVPSFIYLNRKTLEIAIHPIEGENYEQIALPGTAADLAPRRV
jgi:hypothetical protein